jgi:hypothetical protein
MGCAVSSGIQPDDAVWAASGALGSGGVADAPALRNQRVAARAEQKHRREPEPEPELELPALPRIAMADLQEVRLLGVGAFGSVSLVRHRGSGKTYGAFASAAATDAS